MPWVGLTGGIGAGKSTVSTLFEAQGVPCIDTDHITHTLLAWHTETLAQHFSSLDLKRPDGTLNRTTLRTHVFQHPDALAWLEAFLHPKIKTMTHRMMQEAPCHPYGVVVIPLLSEHFDEWQNVLNRVLVIDLPEKDSALRAQARDAADAEHITAIQARQALRETRLMIADDVIENTGSIEALKKKALAQHAQYLACFSPKAAKE